MTDFLKITKLDFFTMKSQSISYLMLIPIIMMFEYMGSSITVLCITGAWFMALMSSNIFAIQEKNNLDRLYCSVSIRLKDIVLGRYVFVFFNYLISFLVIIVLHLGFTLFQSKALELSDIMIGFSMSFLVFSAITGIQMPFYFKMGYTKAKFWSLIPFMAVMALVLLPTFVGALSNVVIFMKSNQLMLITGGILASGIIQFLSYRISVICYRIRKRG